MCFAVTSSFSRSWVEDVIDQLARLCVPTDAKAFATAPKIVEQELFAGMTESLLLAEREVKERTPVGVGGEAAGLKGDIAAQEPQVLADQIIGVVSTSLPHAVPVELGTKPHRPPVQPLAEWARIVLGVSPERAERVGYAIAAKIARVGTEGAFMFERGLDAIRGPVAQIFENRVKRILKRVASLNKGGR